MIFDDNSVILKCDCNCAMLVVEKKDYFEGEIVYNISVIDSRYDHNCNTLWSRIKNAFKALFGKSVYYNDIYIGDTCQFNDFVDALIKLKINKS